MCVNIERMDAELRELDQNLRQMQQNTAAFKLGTELHQKRGELNTRRDQVNRRLEEVAADISRFETQLGELKREETNQREIVEKAKKGESLAAMASRYREAATENRNQAAIQLRRQLPNTPNLSLIHI